MRGNGPESDRPAGGTDSPERRRQRRLVAQIVRDFMTAYGLTRRIGAALRSETLDFADVDRLVDDAPHAILYRLKEDCHALFREGPVSAERPQPGELFDLAVGALFHEAMKFRESYYVYIAYGPRVRQSLALDPDNPLGQAFRRLFDAGYRRMLESEAETDELFLETRQQLRGLLREWSDAGEVARSLLESTERTEEVFEAPVDEILTEVFGSAARGFELAITSLLESGHYAEAAALLDHDVWRRGARSGLDADLVRGLAAYYEGNPCSSLSHLESWVARGPGSDPCLESRARTVLHLIGYEVEETQPELARRARDLGRKLTPPGRP